MKYIEYTIEHFAADVTLLHTWIKMSNKQYDKVVGIARGGLPLATALSYKLNVPLDVIFWQTRGTSNKVMNTFLAEEIALGKRILLVDDIIDSGVAMKEIKESFGIDATSNVDIAVLYYNVAQSVKPTYAVRPIDRTTETRWINFWWENVNV